MKTARIAGWITGATLLALPVGSLYAQGSDAVAAGDRILLHVTGEPQLSDTFTVTPELAIELPTLGGVPLAGVQRDSVTEHLTAFLARYIRDPQVRAQVLIRLGIAGEVVRPGFYALPSNAMLGDLVMAAGGLTQDAVLDGAVLMREKKMVLKPNDVRRSLANGESIATIGVHSGDALQIPRRPDTEAKVRTLGAILAIPLTIVALAALL
jgi:polysaccharide export outer membrane protein